MLIARVCRVGCHRESAERCLASLTARAYDTTRGKREVDMKLMGNQEYAQCAHASTHNVRVS